MVHPLGDMPQKARMARRAVSIQTRSDIERWRVRSKTRLRFLLIAFTIGALPITLMLLLAPGRISSLDDFLFLLVPGFCCFGPLHGNFVPDLCLAF